MRQPLKLTPVLSLIAAIALALPGPAAAAHDQAMTLQDDQQLIYSSPAHVAATLMDLRNMGVDRVRVSVVWSLLAPDPTATRRPHFNASDPNAYPGGAWARYDLIDYLASKDGLQVYFQPVAPAPYWATTRLPVPQGYRYANNPNPALYGQFVRAVGARYDGRTTTTDVTGSPVTLPAVRYWGIWNEPNIGGWLTPQWTRVHGRFVSTAAKIYRGLTRTAWTALSRTGHRHDTIMLGETAAYGAGHPGYGASTDPLTFLRALYCLDGRYRPLHGAAATAIGCPASGSRAAFARANPALLQAGAWAHHPYDFAKPPAARRGDPNSATLSGLSRIETALDRAQRAYGRRGGWPIDITEWGVQSRTPDPYIQFSQAQQATYLNQGEYMAWSDRRVPTFAQFLLVDASPNPAYKPGTKPYWATFQSGLLLYPSEAPKPAYNAFELPIWLPNPRHGSHVFVWGQIRPTDAARVATLEFAPAGSDVWTPVATVQPSNAEGFFTTHVALPTAGGLRIDWTAPSGQPFYSRVAVVR